MLDRGTRFAFYYVQEMRDDKPFGTMHMLRATDCCKAVYAGTKYAVSAGWLYFSVFDKFDKVIFSGKITF